MVLAGSDEVRCYPHDHNALFECKVLSRQHATLTYKAPKFFLRDLDSSNGTFLVTEGTYLSSPFSYFRKIKKNSCFIEKY